MGNIVSIINILKSYNIRIVEDAAEALGSFYNKKHAGTFGDIGILSFNGNKIISTGGGGAIITDKKNLADKIRHISKVSKKNTFGNLILISLVSIIDYLILMQHWVVLK